MDKTINELFVNKINEFNNYKWENIKNYFIDICNDIIKTIKNNKSKKKLNPKFLRKERKACPYCIKTTIDIYDKNGRFIRTEKKKSTVNKSKWYIRKLPEKKNETQHWKCTCKICGNVWTTNTDEQYHYYSDDMDKQFHQQQKLGL